jgi:hypothetical protein
VTQGHNKAPGKLGVVFLKSAVTSGQACDVKGLTDVAGMILIPKQPNDMPEYKPAKPFTIDITRTVKAVAAGEATFNGLALRMVPDRGTDEGYTVRCDVSPTEKIYLEVDAYVD